MGVCGLLSSLQLLQLYILWKVNLTLAQMHTGADPGFPRRRCQTHSNWASIYYLANFFPEICLNMKIN